MNRFPLPVVWFMLMLLLLICKGYTDDDMVLNRRSPKKKKSRVAAVFSFGDSLVDAGNNNYINTTIKADYPPYGRDFPGQIPTGRFSNGLLITDIIAAELGVKEIVPAYLNKSLGLKDLATGVSFASAGSGFDNLTAEYVSVISLWKQVEHFKEYRARLVKGLGRRRTAGILRKSLFIIFTGSNDILANYYSQTQTQRRNEYSEEAYANMLSDVLEGTMEQLLQEGARRMAVYGVPAPGCAPLVKVAFGADIHATECAGLPNEAAQRFNLKIRHTVAAVNARHRSILRAVYVDIFPIFQHLVLHPHQYGFKSSLRGCCGSGYVEVGQACIGVPMCEDSSKLVLWDALHSSQRTYQLTSRIVMDKYISQIL